MIRLRPQNHATILDRPRPAHLAGADPGGRSARSSRCRSATSRSATRGCYQPIVNTGRGDLLDPLAGAVRGAARDPRHRESSRPLNVVVALSLYTLALLTRTVADALTSVQGETTQAAFAMGYRPLRQLFGVELPMALPVLFAGLRVATVANISLVSVGAFVGVGGLGALFTRGFQLGFVEPILDRHPALGAAGGLLRPRPGAAAARG